MTFLSKQDQLQPHFHSKARQLSTHIFVIKKVCYTCVFCDYITFWTLSDTSSWECVGRAHGTTERKSTSLRWLGSLWSNNYSFRPFEPNLFYEKLFLLAKTCRLFTVLKHTVFLCSLLKFWSMLNWKAVQKKAVCRVKLYKFVLI